MTVPPQGKVGSVPGPHTGIITDENRQVFQVEMEATTRQYTVFLKGDSIKGVLGIDQDGKVVSGIGNY